MHVGPRLQEELADILVRWRKHQIAFTADIQKMYRQIHEDDQPLQAILWRFNQREPIHQYQLTTVTYGTTAAPYLAIRTLQQLAKGKEKEYPNASKVALNHFYVDDVVTGAQTIDEAIKLQQELTAMLDKGGFKLHKWSTNELQMQQPIPVELRDPSVPQFKDEEIKKTLGILWIPHQDVFIFKIKRATTALQVKEATIFACTESMITLAWIKEEPSRWKTFVYNRVIEINNLTSKQHWKHVCPDDNPADLISRGTTGSKLKTNKLWWNGRNG